jgi:hypothetical protein
MEELEQIRTQATISVEKAGRLFGLGRTASYEQARLYVATNGTEGLPVLRFGRLLRCPVPALLRLLETTEVGRLTQGRAIGP